MLSDSDSSSSEKHEDVQLTINEHYAKAYKAKKEREELQKLKDKYGSDAELSEDDEDDSEDETEDEDGDELTPAMDVAVLRTLAKIKNRDPSIYDSNKNVFEEEQQTSSVLQLKRKKKNKSKALTIKQHALNAVLDDINSRSRSSTPLPLTYVQEQEALRKETISAFKTAVASDDEAESDSDDDNFLIPREKTKDEIEQEGEEYREFLQREIGPNVDIKELITVDEQVERIHEEGEGDTRIQPHKPKKKKKAEKAKERTQQSDQDFLVNYIFNRGWIDQSAQRVPTYAEITDTKKDKADNKAGKKLNQSEDLDVKIRGSEGEQDESEQKDEVDEEDEFDDLAETFESSYNFRFEEPGAASIASYPRQLPSTVRRVDTSRKEAREKKKQRKEEMKAVKQEEVNRLKALKVRQIRSKIEKIEKEAGKGLNLDEGALKGLENELEDDWDAEKYDQKMKELYGAGDDGFHGFEDHEKPTWDDDIDITDIVGATNDDDNDETTSSKKKKKRKKDTDDTAMTDGVDEFHMDADAIPEDGVDWEQEWDGTDESRKNLWDKYMDEVYELEFNDMIGDLPTRFKYTTVPSESFALTPAEILLATDKELNEYMSVKRFAPYKHKNKAAWDKDRNAKLQELKKAIAGRTWDGVPLEALQNNRSYRSGQGSHGNSNVGRHGDNGNEGQKKKKRMGKKERNKQKLLKTEAETNADIGYDESNAAGGGDDDVSERPKKKRKREES